MQRRTILILGLAWGLLWLLLAGGSPGSHLASLSGDSMMCATLEIVGADHVILPLKVLMLPGALGLDLAAWTLGLLVWPFSGRPWPGAALAAAMSRQPLLGSLVVVAFSGLAGISLAYGIRWVVQAFRRLPARR